MKQLVLTTEVTILGHDIFGRKAWIKFLPHRLPGWFWSYDPNQEPIPITKDLVNNRFKRISLNFRGKSLEFYEHIGSLFFQGLTGVVIQSSQYPPYHGRPLELWDELKQHCQPIEKKIKWLTFKKPIQWSYGNGRRGYMEFIPYNKPLLDITVIIDFPKFGRKEANYGLPNQQTLETIFTAHTIPTAHNRLTYLAMKVAHRLNLWPHHNRLAWPQENNNEELLNQMLLHRAGDLLGAASLLSHKHLVAGHLISYCSGHEADVNMFRQIQLEQF